MKDNKIEEPKHYIRGAFVFCQRVMQGNLLDYYSIKLSSINTLNSINEKETIFYTYKDCCYFVPVPIFELRHAIDSFLFKQDEHWESYGY